MKTFLKAFLITFCTFTLILVGVLYAFVKKPDQGPITVMPDQETFIVDSIPGSGNNNDKPDKVEKTELQKLVENSERINVVVVGLEGPRTDTIIVASFNPITKKTDLISVPRDTYNETKGYDSYDQKKINAVYGRKNGGGTEGIMKAVANILNVPVHYFVTVKYEGATDIIDTLGGVTVNIPFDMDYEDPWAKPPLVIKFDKGTKTLNGEEAVRYLRFRKNSDGTHDEGDLPRIKRQRQFIKSAAKKALSFKLPVLIKTTFDYVKTNMSLQEMGYYARCAVGMSIDGIETYLLPGNAKGKSYYFPDAEAIEGLMIQIYSN